MKALGIIGSPRKDGNTTFLRKKASRILEVKRYEKPIVVYGDTCYLPREIDELI